MEEKYRLLIAIQDVLDGDAPEERKSIGRKLYSSLATTESVVALHMCKMFLGEKPPELTRDQKRRAAAIEEKYDKVWPGINTLCASLCSRYMDYAVENLDIDLQYAKLIELDKKWEESFKRLGYGSDMREHCRNMFITRCMELVEMVLADSQENNEENSSL